MAKKPKKLQVDFTGVEGRKGARRIAEGDYLFKITDYEVDHKKDDEDKKFLVVKYDIEKGPSEGSWSEIFSLTKNALWRFRLFLEAAGFKIPSSAVGVPLEKLPGRRVGATVADDDYEGKTRSKVAEYFSAKDYEALASNDEDEDEEEETTQSVTSGDEDEDEEELELVDDEDL